MLAKSKTQRPDCVFGLHYIMIFIFIWILGAHLHAQSTHHIYDDVLRSLFRLGSYLHVAHTFPLSGQANTIYNIINMHCVYIWCVRSNCKTQNLGRHNNTYDVVRALRVKFKRIDHTFIGWIKPRTESELQTCGTVQNRNSNARDHTFHTLFFIVLFVYLLGCWRYIYILGANMWFIAYYTTQYRICKISGLFFVSCFVHARSHDLHEESNLHLTVVVVYTLLCVWSAGAVVSSSVYVSSRSCRITGGRDQFTFSGDDFTQTQHLIRSDGKKT